MLNVFALDAVLVREQLKELTKQYDKSENDLKALQSVGQVHIAVTLRENDLICNDPVNNYSLNENLRKCVKQHGTL